MKIGIIGGGPSALFILKTLLEQSDPQISITIFERDQSLGKGMPYSSKGANTEHITNVSGNELPELNNSLKQWIRKNSAAVAQRYGVDVNEFSDYKTVPRLLLGDYLSDEFAIQLKKAKELNIEVTVNFSTTITDIIPDATDKKVSLQSENSIFGAFDKIIICSGHHWPEEKERTVKGYFDSPYPPAKLKNIRNHHVGIRGSSLTAIDAIRTLCRNNGHFTRISADQLTYSLDADCSNFKITMYSGAGLLPAIRFHLEDVHLNSPTALSEEQILANIVENEGFLSLDYLFENNFKAAIKISDPDFYEIIESMQMEEFVDTMLAKRMNQEPFDLFKEEYKEAAKSIRDRKSIYWKEALGGLSFAMNYPAKHFSAEDMIRLRKVLMPLISAVIAYVPQTSCQELLAIHNAGLLHLIEAGHDNETQITPEGEIEFKYTDHNGKDVSQIFETFINCTGQSHFEFEDFPYKTLLNEEKVSMAKLKFRSAIEGKKAWDKQKDAERASISKENEKYFLRVPGVAITDNFQIIDSSGKPSNSIYLMAVPYIGGYNPDYSGLDFCEKAAQKITESLNLS